MEISVVSIARLLDLKWKINSIDFQIFEKENIDVRTFRINLTPIKLKNGQSLDKEKIKGQIQAISDFCEKLNIRWFNVPFYLMDVEESLSSEVIELALEIIKNWEKKN